jgi:hypothetical protein
MAKNAVGIRLPDLYDRVQNRAIAFFQGATGEQNMLPAGTFSLEVG